MLLGIVRTISDSSIVDNHVRAVRLRRSKDKEAKKYLFYNLLLIALLWACAVPVTASGDERAEPSSGQHDGAAVMREICPGGVCPGLGNAFYLNTKNVLGRLGGGRIIFDDRHIDGCVRWDPVGRTIDGFSYSDSSSEFISYLTTDSGISAGFETQALSFKSTFHITTGWEYSREESVRSNANDKRYPTGELIFERNSRCWSRENLSDDLVRALESLPLVGDNPENEALWSEYFIFLRIWGSHIMIKQTLGSRFQRWESVEDTSEVTQRDLEIKTCVSVEGVSPANPGWSSEVCSQFSEAERQASQRHTTSGMTYVVGGTDETRKALLNELTEENLRNFIDSADEADEPYHYGWFPIWDLLSDFYLTDCVESGSEACKNLERTLNLQVAFEALLGLECYKEERNGTLLQGLVKQEGGNFSRYVCQAEPLGCRSNADCNGFWGFCYCHGSSCVDMDLKRSVGDPEEPEDHFNGIRLNRSGNYNVGVNTSCELNWFSCECDPSSDSRILWRPERSLRPGGEQQAGSLGERDPSPGS